MVQGSPVQSVKEHKPITDEIDNVYMETVDAAAAIRTFLISKTGNKREQFLSFHRSFLLLFLHTQHMVVKERKDLVDEIEGWFFDCRYPRFGKILPDEFIEDGTNLFVAYKAELIKCGMITITR